MNEFNKEPTLGQPPKNGRPAATGRWRFSRCENQRRAERRDLPTVLEASGPMSGPLLRGPSSRSARTATTSGAVSGCTPRSWSRSRLRRGFLHVACAMMLCLVAIRGAGADAPTLSETQVKALFLFNFTKYVEWPESAFDSPTAPLTIGLLGDTELAEPLRALTAGKTVNGHPIVIEEIITADKATNCHILFLSRELRGDQAALLLTLRGQPVLAVGEHEKFTRLGGVVNFGRRDNKVRLEINTVTAEESRLKLSSKLLGVADVVQYKP